MAQHRLFGIFWTDTTTGRPMWAMSRNGKRARTAARKNHALCTSMVLPDHGPWDAPTFRVSCDRIECDYRP